jgi:hypothetical protein
MRKLVAAFLLAIVLVCAGCGSREAALRRTVAEVGAQQLRTDVLNACREGFAAGGAQKIAEARWPTSVRRFEPISLWAEPDGAYILMDSDADGERGVFLPRVDPDKDPLCGPKLTHVKLASGVYTYDRKR